MFDYYLLYPNTQLFFIRSAEEHEPPHEDIDKQQSQMITLHSTTQNTLHPSSDESIETNPDPIPPINPAFGIKHLQSIVYGGPRLEDTVSDVPSLEAGDFGLTADEAAAINEDIAASPEFQRHIERMHAIDRQFEQRLRSIMLDASIEFGLLDELERNGDPNDDNETDILERVEKYAAEFKSRVNGIRDAEGENE